MTHARNTLNLMLALVVIALVGAPRALAEGSAQQSTPVTEGYVDTPIPIYITIKDAEEWDPPEMPTIEGLEIHRNEGTQTASSVRVFNGKVTENREVTYTFAVTARQAGTYEIPAFPITVDGRMLDTFPVTLTFRKAENNGLLSVEVSGNPDRIYQGESTMLTMQILIRQYTDPRYKVSPDSREMWQLVKADSNWGPFTDTMNELYNSRQAPRGRPQTLLDETGQTQTYFLYQVRAEVRPTSTGPLDLSDILIRMSYPVSLRRDRGFFAAGLQVDQVQPLEAVATGGGVVVEPLPSAGRPDLFNGAVGRFSITTIASPTTVAVGDPITLTMTVTDQGDQPVDMDVVPAPELHKVPSLEDDFRVPREPLAGVVAGRTKIFTQTIRARNDTVESIPPIPYAFFDPDKATYETADSRPILLDVSASESITSSDIPGSVPTNRPGTFADLHSVSGGLLANYTGPDRLLADQGPPEFWWLLVLLIAPPVAVAGFVATRQGVRGHLGDAERVRSRRAGRTALAKLAAARSAPEAQRGAMVAEAICTYVADRLGLPAAGFMRGDAIAALEARGVDPDITAELDRLVTTCEHLQYAGGSGTDISTMTDSARTLVGRLETSSRSRGNKQGVRS